MHSLISKTDFFLVILFICSFLSESIAQVTFTPSFPTADQPITIIYDASKGTSALVGISSVSIHTGVILSSQTGTNWTNVPTTWGNPEAASKMTSLGNNKWSFTINNPRTYFGVPTPTPIYRIGMVFRESGPCGGFSGASVACKEGKSDTNGDIFINLSSGGFDLTVTSPTLNPLFKNSGEIVKISAITSSSSTISIKINGIEVASQNNTTQIDYDHTISETGLVSVDVTATDGVNSLTKSFTYVVRQSTVLQPIPNGIMDGINYSPTDATKVTLSLLAPLKSTVYVVGDFNDWKVSPEYQMKKDGERFWMEISGLASGVEYAYQYLVDETLYVADPFCDKILDPLNDPFIPAQVYPALKAYPTLKANGIVSVLQTGQAPYVWQTTNYTKPANEKLLIYELLVRDFEADKSYQGVINRLDYLKNLGINAIELMPVMEFSGNDSWGYNPIFYLAPDKAYGPKDKLKELIDKAHAKGIAIILDIVLNHADYEFPYVKMYWDGDKPAANNPWFNQTATHPFSFFFDFNHDSPYTEKLVDRINNYWVSEYKVDGFRFDLSKGFTQTITTDVGAWGNYDQSRVDNLTRMANKIWETNPTTYVTLEHLGIDSEERVLANSGMMLWGIMREQFKQNSIGASSNSDVARTFYKNRSGSWNSPSSIIAYMESQDEERIMVDNIKNGRASGAYDIKNLPTGLDRIKAVSTFLFSVPGPKMMWQFGELGYDLSINSCTDGSINNNCRTSAKPTRWNYFTDIEREKVYKVFSSMLNMRNLYDVFSTSDVTITGGNSLIKSIILKNEPYVASPTTVDDMNVVLVGNFDIVSNSASITFPHVGSWYHFFSAGDLINVSSSTTTFTLQPGEFRLYTDVKLPLTDPELTPFVRPIRPTLESVIQLNNTIKISWIDNSSIEQGYRIYRKKIGENYGLVVELPSNSISYTDNTGLLSNSEYEYYVEAFNSAGNSSSNPVSVTTDVITAVDFFSDAVSIYPIPSNEILRVESSLLIHSLELISTRGERIVANRIDLNSWDINSISSGIYLAEIKIGNSLVYRRVIKK